MKVITNKYIPFHGFIAMAFFNIILWREEYKYLLKTSYYDTIVNHESIHEALMRDFCKWLPLGGLIFYIVYLVEWLGRLFFTKDFMSQNAYRHLSFEVEAKEHEKDLTYLQNRKAFAQFKK